MAGFAENTISDPTRVAPQVLQFKPVIWEKGEIQELPTFPADPDGEALAINDNGQVVGLSGGRFFRPARRRNRSHVPLAERRDGRPRHASRGRCERRG